jgi:hypothetical protein
VGRHCFEDFNDNQVLTQDEMAEARRRADEIRGKLPKPPQFGS